MKGGKSKPSVKNGDDPELPVTAYELFWQDFWKQSQEKPENYKAEKAPFVARAEKRSSEYFTHGSTPQQLSGKTIRMPLYTGGYWEGTFTRRLKYVADIDTLKMIGDKYNNYHFKVIDVVRGEKEEDTFVVLRRHLKFSEGGRASVERLYLGDNGLWYGSRTYRPYYPGLQMSSRLFVAGCKGSYVTIMDNIGVVALIVMRDEEMMCVYDGKIML
ncbi:hypothetical protein M8C21_029069 [Ambrosia artemisiifolia]|uniref:Uncharacterized protein n=1 Tax=Ambrosia artemisiifolia TaxID=4212 RepID=A0AAD5GDN7_AMBAR|nr:hypothetical protein M8C21_029069 [Ambrosia artemisiifolia]